jgi:hypothetical protein
MFRDLVPGMSDFDTRFIVRDGMIADDWCQMSTVIGEAHLLGLCQTFSCWARNLEHLPRINLTWSELTSERTYYTEYRQWSFYYSRYAAKVSSLLEWLVKRRWDAKDEYFRLKKFCSLYGRYNRSNGPPIVLRIHENNYPLHSRHMHYSTPAVQAAARLLASEEILHAKCELSRLYREPLLSAPEDHLEMAWLFC